MSKAGKGFEGSLQDVKDREKSGTPWTDSRMYQKGYILLNYADLMCLRVNELVVLV